MAELLPPPSNDSCLGIHVPEPRPNRTVLRWAPVQPTAGRVRVRAYTCDCQPTFYELCQAGGQLFIRRTQRLGARVLVDESEPFRYAKALIMWTKLMEGLAW
ncbi:hypothetical protein EDD27_0349 [Nonomuraea polychroma]|uniref:Uncharacterized protein n=1 Tax=Nonomuraea polychroma TaxID=46176 RepID=A0A438LX35_9ACTN|nr:hypothetical protein EDD27_0349 [Nonomuraea polychroma]